MKQWIKTYLKVMNDKFRSDFVVQYYNIKIYIHLFFLKWVHHFSKKKGGFLEHLMIKAHNFDFTKLQKIQ